MNFAMWLWTGAVYVSFFFKLHSFGVWVKLQVKIADYNEVNVKYMYAQFRGKSNQFRPWLLT